jgi:hypothetical protein
LSGPATNAAAPDAAKRRTRREDLMEKALAEGEE